MQRFLPGMCVMNGPVTTGGYEQYIMLRASSCLLFKCALGKSSGEKGIFRPDIPHESDDPITMFTARDN